MRNSESTVRRSAVPAYGRAYADAIPGATFELLTETGLRREFYAAS